MTVDPASPTGKCLGLGLTGLTFAAIWLLIVTPTLSTIEEKSEAVTRDERLLLSYERRAATLPTLQQNLMDLHQQRAEQVGFFGVADNSNANTRLQNLVRQIAADNRTDLKSIQILPNKRMEEFGAESIALRIDVTLPESALLDFLFGLEQTQPYVFLSNLTVRGLDTLNSAPSAGGRTLSIQTDVVAYVQIASP